MDKSTITIILAVIIIGGAVLIFGRPQSSEAPIVPAPVLATTSTPALAPVAEEPVSQSFALAEVATHNSATSCWSAIGGKVYDLTSWIGRHPGGASAILSICGKDGTVAFTGQHGGQKRPASELAGFAIGNLK